jgi:hypothetical protein
LAPQLNTVGAKRLRTILTVDYRGPLLVLVSLATFLLAAKSHGRQIRLERERAGFHHVVFGGSNPSFVEQLWRRDRLHYWPTFALVFFVVALARWKGLGPDGFGDTAWALWFLPFVSAFSFAGLWSLTHFAGTRAENPEFTDAAVRTSALIWPLVFSGVVVALRLFFVRVS